MKILDGKQLSKRIEAEVREEVILLNQKFIYPTLAVILVGDDPASSAYVRMKSQACERVGINSLTFAMPASTSEQILLSKIEELNADSKVDGILVQLPLPSHIDTHKVLEAIDPYKDVDGFHALSVGKMILELGGFTPATPLGVMRLLEEYKIDLVGRDCVVVGASNIVGKPLASLLLNANATISICHIHTKDLASYTREADIVLVGVGRPNLITADMIKEGAVVVDIGINRLANGELVGDVDFANVAPKCSFITPVPGGVGPMTIAMLLQNTLQSAKNKLQTKEN
ncbi:bifunctional methylenetetrahydrofolate dehydrogenase/methenyltetrahydrofolate cyclohydrolase [Helicobacter enhydrae]|uniref:Bifunctional protein FolD n=1 Tax=Helicobacter enhydrae TaxID=222136 RepID=A0A1B1U3V5_9HELI|nr:bifunctional methylenetetrahydrofolate dehydrogenase/methenyltetrahydrofolate cyclohydrolase FolD [Helicobacter enhydrae]ANV97436.1 bifunctional methylenetetrahydrofolate dehydrogenase/methenyltetrahydrofolate cyclohydrolase [Helicobacter enhydrae]